jgi:hypothetical protein
MAPARRPASPAALLPLLPCCFRIPPSIRPARHGACKCRAARAGCTRGRRSKATQWRKEGQASPSSVEGLASLSPPPKVWPVPPSMHRCPLRPYSSCVESARPPDARRPDRRGGTRTPVLGGAAEQQRWSMVRQDGVWCMGRMPHTLAHGPAGPKRPWGGVRGMGRSVADRRRASRNRRESTMEKAAVACMLSGRSPACSRAATVTASRGLARQGEDARGRAWEFHVGNGSPHRLRGGFGQLTCRKNFVRTPVDTSAKKCTHVGGCAKGELRQRRFLDSGHLTAFQSSTKTNLIMYVETYLLTSPILPLLEIIRPKVAKFEKTCSMQHCQPSWQKPASSQPA